MIPFPDKKYKIIYADPPWRYSDKLSFHGGGAEAHYNTMSIEDICNLPVNSITDSDAILFLWGTWPQLPECLKVVKSWGFTYKTIAFVWVKQYSNGKDVLGLGRWTRGNTEFCLLAVKGKPKRIDQGTSQLIKTKIQKHSKKPDIVREKIVRLIGDLPRIELFARQKTVGWDVWGNDEKLNLKPLEEYQFE